MSPHDFVTYIHELGVGLQKSTLMGLQEPPGRIVSDVEKTRSEWFRHLPDIEKRHIEDIVRIAVQGTIFAILVELDGDGSFSRYDENGMLRLTFEKGEASHLLNDPEDENLHDVYRSLIEW